MYAGLTPKLTKKVLNQFFFILVGITAVPISFILFEHSIFFFEKMNSLT